MSEKKAEKKAAGKGTETSFVYCGPSVRGVAKQYTVFSGGMPEALEEFKEKHPAIDLLIVPVDKFSEMRRRLSTKGTAEALIFEGIMKEI